MSNQNSMVIYTDKIESVEMALKTMTDEWIESGNYCEKTVKTMREVCKSIIKQKTKHDLNVKC